MNIQFYWVYLLILYFYISIFKDLWKDIISKDFLRIIKSYAKESRLKNTDLNTKYNNFASKRVFHHRGRPRERSGGQPSLSDVQAPIEIEAQSFMVLQKRTRVFDPPTKTHERN